MIRLIFDGTFPGLLTALWISCKKNYDTKAIISIDIFSENFLYEDIFVETENSIFESCYNAIQKKFSKNIIQNFYNLFVSLENKDSIDLLIYLKLLSHYGSNPDPLNSPQLIELRKSYDSMLKEVHRWKGLMRFKKISNEIYYSNYIPSYPITFLISSHFSDRFPTSSLIINDSKRNEVAIYKNSNWEFTSFSKEVLNSLDNHEDNFEELFKVFHQNVSIKERTSISRQMRFIPKKYWSCLPEMKGLSNR